MRIINGIMAAVRMCKFIKGDVTADHLVYYGQEDGVTREEAGEVLSMKEAA